MSVLLLLTGIKEEALSRTSPGYVAVFRDVEADFLLAACELEPGEACPA